MHGTSQNPHLTKPHRTCTAPNQQDTRPTEPHYGKHHTMRIHTHPGEILREEYMIPLKLSANALSRAIDVPPNRITSIVAQERAVTPDTAIRLARYFNTTPQFWLNLQMAHDLSVAQAEHGAEINDRVRPRAA